MPDSSYFNTIPNSNSNSQIHLLFHPKNIAVIGASSTPLKGGYRILENLISNGFEGEIFPINPKGGIAFELKFYKTILEVPQYDRCCDHLCSEQNHS